MTSWAKPDPIRSTSSPERIGFTEPPERKVRDIFLRHPFSHIRVTVFFLFSVFTDLRKEVIKNSGIGAVDALNGQIEEIRMRLNLLDINQPINSDFDNQYPQNQMMNQNINGSGFQQAGMPNEFNNQSTGGISPGQPMGEF